LVAASLPVSLKRTLLPERASRVKRFFVLSTAAQPLRNLLLGSQVR
jgi:hypothetical protein